MSLVLPKQEIASFDDYRHWLCDSGQKYYEEVWSFKKKETILQEYLAICYAKKIKPVINREDDLSLTRLSSKN